MRFSRAARWFIAAAAIGPLLFIGWQLAAKVRNVPFQDEFATALDFLLRFRGVHTWPDFMALLFHQENEHRIVTSRLIFLTMRGLTGGINFGVITVLGDLFMVAAIGVIAWQERQPAARLLLAAVLCLLIFQMQHYENLFLSYASIDHFHIVLLGAVSLALLNRGTPWGDLGGMVFAGLACFTLAHGMALFPAGALILVHQRRWRSLVAWVTVAASCSLIYFYGLKGAMRPIPAFSSFAGWSAFVQFWLGLLGGVPALGSAVLAPFFGVAGLGAVGWLGYRGAWRREAFLCALVVAALGATFLIAYGRFGFAAFPATSSRYMVQSAVLWSVLSLLLLKEMPAQMFMKGAACLVVLAALLNVAGNVRFREVSEVFLQHRRLAVRYYLRNGTMQGAPFSIYPDSAVADRLLFAAKQTGLYVLGPQLSPQGELSGTIQEQNLDHCIDELTVGPDCVFVRGWMLPPLGRKMAYEPFLILESGNRQFVFKGERVDRPDVATVHARPAASECGFRFDVPRTALPKSKFKMSLAMVGWDGTLMTRVMQRFSN